MSEYVMKHNSDLVRVKSNNLLGGTQYHTRTGYTHSVIPIKINIQMSFSPIISSTFIIEYLAFHASILT